MLSMKTITIILALVAPIFATQSSLRTRDLNVCDTLKACYLVNIKTRNETELDGSDSFQIDPTNEEGYTIRCDASGVFEMHFMKFMYSNIVHEEFGAPRYMFGDAGQGQYLNKVDYISTCGRKTLTVEGHVWSKKCFTKKYNINVRNPKGVRCASAPAKAPVKAPLRAPSKAPLSPPAALCKPRISGFTLIDADLDEDIMPLSNFTRKEGLLNIRANVAPCGVVDSVLMILDGIARCERHTPYSVFADDSSTDISNDAAQYYGERIGVGRHVISATPYSGEKCDGIVGSKFTQRFQVL